MLGVNCRLKDQTQNWKCCSQENVSKTVGAGRARVFFSKNAGFLVVRFMGIHHIRLSSIKMPCCVNKICINILKRWIQFRADKISRATYWSCSHKISVVWIFSFWQTRFKLHWHDTGFQPLINFFFVMCETDNLLTWNVIQNYFKCLFRCIRSKYFLIFCCLATKLLVPN